MLKVKDKNKKILAGLVLLILLFLLAASRLEEGSTRLPLLGQTPSFKLAKEVPMRTNQGLGPTFGVVDNKKGVAYVMVPKRECFALPDATSGDEFKSLVGVLDLETNELIKKIELPYNLLGGALSPDRKWLYLANSFDDRLTVIDTQNLEVVKTIAVGPNPIAVADNSCGDSYNYKPQHVVFSRDGKYAYTSNSKGGAVTVIDTSSHEVIKRIQTATPEEVAASEWAGSTWGIAAHPTRDLVYTAGKFNGLLYIINTTSNQIVGKIEITPPVTPLGLAVDPQGKNLWVTDSSSRLIVVVDTQTEKQAARIDVGSDKAGTGPAWISFSKDGNWAYIAPEAANTVTIVDAREFKMVNKIETEGYPFAAVPAGDKLLVMPREADSLQIWE